MNTPAPPERRSKHTKNGVVFAATTRISLQAEKSMGAWRILIAQGRDAADVPLTHIFGPGTLSDFRVWADEVPGEFIS